MADTKPKPRPRSELVALIAEREVELHELKLELLAAQNAEMDDAIAKARASKPAQGS